MTGRNRYFRSSPIRVIMAALLIVALLPAAAVSAAETAPPVAWNVTFSPEENSKFDAVANTADGGYIALGSTLTEVYGGNEDLLLVKTDGQGNEVWTQRLPEMEPPLLRRPLTAATSSAVTTSPRHLGEDLAYQGTHS